MLAILLICLIMCGYLYAFLTPAGKAKAKEWWAWWNPYDFAGGIINGKALKRHKDLQARYLANRIAANKERVATRRAKERREALGTTHPWYGSPSSTLQSPAPGGFSTHLPEVDVVITGGAGTGPDHLDTRRARAKLEGISG